LNVCSLRFTSTGYALIRRNFSRVLHRNAFKFTQLTNRPKPETAFREPLRPPTGKEKQVGWGFGPPGTGLVGNWCSQGAARLSGRTSIPGSTLVHCPPSRHGLARRHWRAGEPRVPMQNPAPGCSSKRPQVTSRGAYHKIPGLFIPVRNDKGIDAVPQSRKAAARFNRARSSAAAFPTINA
jgi:hypothetical protein